MIEKYYVYVLKCLGTDTYYVGQTTRIRQRLEEHIRGHGARFTAQHRPAEIIGIWSVRSRADALVIEKSLSKFERRRIDVHLKIVQNCTYIDVVEFMKLLEPNSEQDELRRAKMLAKSI